MGRKGGGGGTAGGGRSGRRGNITFNRVVPKFLQNIQAKQATEMAKARQIAEQEKEKRYMERQSKSQAIQEPSSREVIAELEKEGFNVVQAAGENVSKGEAEDTGSGKKDMSRLSASCASKPNGGLKGVAHGGVEKTKRRSVRPTNAFRVNNNQRLSFADDNSDSDESE